MPIFAATLFVSALLLFSVQPLFTKMVLPRLGGAPSVWSVAMVAFQAFLFAGYVYAHLLARWLAPARAALAHLAVLACAAVALPLGVAAGFEAPPGEGVTLWLVGLFALSIGFPFVALSATAPLLQAWFAASGHRAAGNPYVLYAASNLGSFCALLAYPFLIEPLFSLNAQSLAWSIGFALLAPMVALAACGAATQATASPADRPRSATPGAAQRLSWMLLSAVPAGLVVAVTAYITTDVAAAPFLWVLPLALYLLTFVAVFRTRPWLPHAAVLRYLPYLIAPLAVSIFGRDKVFFLTTILLNLAAFTMIALACHGEAYRRRPAPDRLTEFYLWSSFGGVLGGVFAGLLAPNLFDNILEYPLLILAALISLPAVWSGGVRHALREAAPGLIAALLAAMLLTLATIPAALDGDLVRHIAVVGVAALMLFYAHRPARFAGFAVAAFVVTGLWQPGTTAIVKARSFFGVHQVVETAGGTHRLLYHGTTLHGAERLDGVTPPAPLTYYYFGGPLSEAVDAARNAGGLARVAAVGLGTGSLACHRRDGEDWQFFEIDPEVVRIARNPRLFRFLGACAPHARIVLGDGRLTLAASPDSYNLIVLDVFSSDAIPVHVLTREAFAGYLARLAPRGVIAVHVSNRHMALAPVVAAVGRDAGLVAWVRRDDSVDDLAQDYRANAEVVVLARDAADLGDLPSRAGWRPLAPRPDVSSWTDDYSDVLRAILRKKLGG